MGEARRAVGVVRAEGVWARIGGSEGSECENGKGREGGQRGRSAEGCRVVGAVGAVRGVWARIGGLLVILLKNSERSGRGQRG